VEPDYLPHLEVFYFQPCLYPMKYLHPRSMYTLPRGGVQRGGTPSIGSRGDIPRLGGLGTSGPPARVQGRTSNKITKSHALSFFISSSVSWVCETNFPQERQARDPTCYTRTSSRTCTEKMIKSILLQYH
jgi:hypothetical protein